MSGREDKKVDKESCCANCALRRTLKTIEGVIVAHKCIQNDEFITDFAHSCPYWEEMRIEQKDAEHG